MPKKRGLYDCVNQYQWRKKQFKKLPNVGGVSSSSESEGCDSTDLTKEDKREIRKQKIKKRKKRQFHEFQKQLKNRQSRDKRTCIRPGVENVRSLCVSDDQIGSTWDLSQSVAQRRILAKSTKLAVDNKS